MINNERQMNNMDYKEIIEQYPTGSIQLKDGKVTIEDLDTFYRTGAYNEYGDQAVGVAQPKGWKVGKEAIFLPLDSFDHDYVKDVKIKPGEVILRYENETTKIGGMRPLIKVNPTRGLLYFLTPEASEEDRPEFETRGLSVEFMRFRKDNLLTQS